MMTDGAANSAVHMHGRGQEEVHLDEPPHGASMPTGAHLAALGGERWLQKGVTAFRHRCEYMITYMSETLVAKM